MTNEKINAILNEMYDIDPTLKGREEELTKALSKMLEIQPKPKINETFKNDLRQRLYVEAKYSKQNNASSGNFFKILTGFLMGGVVAVFGFMTISTIYFPKEDMDKMPVNNMPMLNSFEEDAGSLQKTVRGVSAPTPDVLNDDTPISNEEVETSDTFDINSMNFADSMPVSDVTEFVDTIEQYDVLGKKTKYVYTYDGELPEIPAEMKYYAIHFGENGGMNVDEKTEKIDVNLDFVNKFFEKFIDESMPEVSYSENIKMKTPKLFYTKEFIDGVEYIIPSLIFEVDKEAIKGDGFLQVIKVPLIDLKVK